MFSDVNITTIPGAAAPASADTLLSSGPDPWTAKAATVAAFVADHGRLPAPGPDLVEDEMAGWVAVQRRAAQQGRVTAAHRDYLDTNIPGWRQTRQDRWAAQLHLLSEARKTGTPVRGQLRVWLKSQRRAASQGTLLPARKTALDAQAPGWNVTGADSDARWMARAEDLANHVDFAGRLPAGTAGGEAGGLYRWMVYQRSLAKEGRLPKKRRAWLDKNVPGWLPEQDGRETRWTGQADALASFVLAHGRLPRVTAADEKALARWVGTQRAVARSGRLSTARHTRLDQAAPGWLSAGRSR